MVLSDIESLLEVELVLDSFAGALGQLSSSLKLVIYFIYYVKKAILIL